MVFWQSPLYLQRNKSYFFCFNCTKLILWTSDSKLLIIFFFFPFSAEPERTAANTHRHVKGFSHEADLKTCIYEFRNFQKTKRRFYIKVLLVWFFMGGNTVKLGKIFNPEMYFGFSSFGLMHVMNVMFSSGNYWQPFWCFHRSRFETTHWTTALTSL